MTRVDHRMAMVNELAEAMLHLHHARKLALAKGVLNDRQARRLARAMHALEDEISAVIAGQDSGDLGQAVIEQALKGKRT